MRPTTAGWAVTGPGVVRWRRAMRFRSASSFDATRCDRSARNSDVEAPRSVVPKLWGRSGIAARKLGNTSLCMEAFVFGLQMDVDASECRRILELNVDVTTQLCTLGRHTALVGPGKRDPCVRSTLTERCPSRTRRTSGLCRWPGPTKCLSLVCCQGPPPQTLPNATI